MRRRREAIPAPQLRGGGATGTHTWGILVPRSGEYLVPRARPDLPRRGDRITVDASALNTPCIHVEAGQTLHGVRYNNTTTESGIKDITLEATISGIKTETTNHVICPTQSGSTEVHEGGTYTGKAIVTGFKDAEHKEPTSIWTTEAETP